MKTSRLSFGWALPFAVFVLRGVDCKVKVREGNAAGGEDYDNTCLCSGSNEGFNSAGTARFTNASLFPADYGTSCKAWDNVDCPKAWPGETYGPWCCSSWCYVANATCEDAIPSVESPGLFYAYFGPCGVDNELINVTNCPLHHSWDNVSSRASGFLKHAFTYAIGDSEVCAEEEEEDTAALKTLSYVLGIAIVGAGVGVLIFVWIIRCDPTETRDWLYESLCGCMSKSEEPSEQSEDDDPSPPQEQQTASKTAKSLTMLDSASKSNLATVSD